ncbi:hypothetical protein GWI33_016740 [Rhynchophorus ferrugineus]|uniref:Gustatory receptor n=1 Tax=Rhynchophorus ferrugineus TaxID=354439 RepID=A0A834HXE1_RHYFE|nr:hypothetical protein GWI33_016740 [Rhynchophorus ferrugineus]
MIAFAMSYKPKLSVVLFTLTLYGTRSALKYLAICLMVHLRERFMSINRMMYFIADTNSPSIADKIKRLCRLHFKLSHAANKLNTIVSTELLLSFGFSLTSLFFFGYYLYYILANMQRGLHNHKQFDTIKGNVNIKAHLQTNAILLGFAVISLIQEIQELLFLVIIFHKVCSKANKTPKYLHRLRNISSANTEIDIQIRRMSIKFLHQKLILSVVGLFKINFTVIYSMSGTLITYLVIFIQYDLSLRHQNVNP